MSERILLITKVQGVTKSKSIYAVVKTQRLKSVQNRKTEIQ